MGKKRIIKAHTDKAGSSVGVENLSIQNNLTVTGATQSGSFTTNGTDTFDYEEATINLVNSGSKNMNGTIKLTKIGNLVTLSSVGIITHDLSSDLVSGVVIPAGFIPTDSQATLYRVEIGARLCQITPRTDGTFALTYWNTSYGLYNDTDSFTPFAVTYRVD